LAAGDRSEDVDQRFEGGRREVAHPHVTVVPEAGWRRHDIGLGGRSGDGSPLHVGMRNSSGELTDLRPGHRCSAIVELDWMQDPGVGREAARHHRADRPERPVQPLRDPVTHGHVGDGFKTRLHLTISTR
jgi:hypothetical protein